MKTELQIPGVSETLTLGEQIRILREREGLKQSELAERAGLVKHSIYHIESGERYPRDHNLKRILEALGFTVRVIVDPDGLVFEGYDDPALGIEIRAWRLQHPYLNLAAVRRTHRSHLAPLRAKYRRQDIKRKARPYGLTLRHLAERAGITQHALYKLELGQTQPKAETIRKILAALGKSIRLTIEPNT